MLRINTDARRGLILHPKCGTYAISHALDEDWFTISIEELITSYKDVISLWAYIIRHPLDMFVSVFDSHTPSYPPKESWEAFVDWALANPNDGHIKPLSLDLPVSNPIIVKLEDLDAGLDTLRAEGFPIRKVHKLNQSQNPLDRTVITSRGYRTDEILALYDQDLKAYGYVV